MQQHITQQQLTQRTQPWPEGSFHVALTGHRPKSLPGGYDDNHPFYHALYQRLYSIMERGLAHHSHFVLHSGMALGADTVWAYVITALQRAYPGRFSFVAEVPLLTQPSTWPAKDQQQWAQLVQQADHVNLYGEVYHPSVLMKRNTGMIQACDLVIAVINKDSHTGGTAHAVKEAENMSKQVFKIHPEDLA